MNVENFEGFNNSFITLSRKILSWEWYTDCNTFKVFIHCLLRANYKDEKYRGILIKRGQFITGRRKLSAETGLTERQIRTALNHLETTNEITKSKKGSYTIITINKYNEYQSIKQTTTNEMTNERPSNDQAMTTNNNINNNNKYNTSLTENKKIDIYMNPDINRFISRYKEINRGARVTGSMYKKIGEAIDLNGLDYVLEALDKSAHKGHNINGEFIPLSLANMLDNIQSILDDTYNLTSRPTRAEYNPYL